MKLEGYTPELFLENFIEDCAVFGEETAQAIYEEIFSAITGKNVKLGKFVETLEESMNEYLEENTLLETPAFDVVKDYKEQIVNSFNKYVAGTGILSKIGSFITSLPGKVKALFGGLKGKSFGEIMKQGMGWLKANPALALKTTGGIALVALLIRALKKRGELNKYKALAAIDEKASTLKEDCYDTFEDTKEKIAMRKVLEECKTNRALAKVILGSRGKKW